MKRMIQGLKILLLFTLLTGVMYPALVTGIAQIAFSEKANGSCILQNQELVGSKLIAQKFSQPKYFWGRPSAVDHQPMPSGGSNLSLTNNELINQVKARQAALGGSDQVPVELLFASASGLDPHISAEAAHFQIERIGLVRHWTQEKVRAANQLIDDFSFHSDYGLWGPMLVNVLQLNLKLDERF